MDIYCGNCDQNIGTQTNNDFNKMVVDLKLEKQRREDAEKALQFYADIKNWYGAEHFAREIIDFDDVEGKFHQEAGTLDFGGKRAREHFEKYKGRNE